jgi:hypothetical protein
MSLDALGDLKDLSVERIRLYQDSSGSLKLVIEGETEEFSVAPFVCFPFTGQDEFISLMRRTPDGNLTEEIVLLSDYKKLDAQSRRLIEEELEKSAHILITRVYAVTQKRFSLEWDIQIEGQRQIIESKDQRDLFQIGPALIVINAMNGRKYIVKVHQLDSKSRALVGAYV